jgi:hypothetical protein
LLTAHGLADLIRPKSKLIYGFGLAPLILH